MNDMRPIDKSSVCEILADIYPTDGEKVVGVERIDKAYEAVLALPPAEPERKRGKWIPFPKDSSWYECSECGAVYENKSSMDHFCSACGAYLMGDEE